ncbi:MAG: hypothetical protein EBS99_18235, partial [Betaproteobacteria bacterium]|nr:hypothetical protein [Betaproteobacteria bacterium]
MHHRHRLQRLARPFCIVSLIMTLGACSSPQRLAYPTVARGEVVDVYHGTVVADPYRALEDLRAPATQEFVRAQNALAQPWLENLPQRERLRTRLTEIWNHERTGVPRAKGGRLFFTAEQAMPAFDRCCTLIRVPPLRVRRQDLGEWLRYGIRQRSRKLGWERPPEVDQAVVKRLQSYDFPNNLRELEALIYRALQQVRRQEQANGSLSANGSPPANGSHLANGSPPANGALPALIPEDVFWTSPRQQRYRFDLWRWKPQLREWMRAPWLWNGLLFGLVSWLFVAVNLWLWLG